MNTYLPENSQLVFYLKQKALDTGLFEAFLESAPQMILQCSIILRTGVTSKVLVILYSSQPSSFFKLSRRQNRCYAIEITKFSDNWQSTQAFEYFNEQSPRPGLFLTQLGS